MLSKITLDEIDKKIAPTEVGQRKPNCHHLKFFIGFKNPNKYLIHIQLIGFDLKSKKKLDLDMKPDHLNGFKMDQIELDMD